MRPLGHAPRSRLLASIAVAGILSVATLGMAPRPSAALEPWTTPGLSRLLAVHVSADLARGIATFDSAPTSAQVSALRGLGLAVQPMEHLPLALVYGPIATLQAAVTGGMANDVYPDERIELLDSASSDAMGSAGTRAAGLTGRGVTVAVVDSGCDASHPDLADHVVHNVKLYSGEYANQSPDSSTTIVVANEAGPYQNTDIGSGHGTHVAGIIAADSTSVTDGSRFGVAPDAELVCYSIGEVLFTTAVLTAYDHMLDQPDLWGIDVVNNSWGNSFRQFDPRDPVHVATRAVTAQGVVVVFAGGNSGDESVEMSLNPFSEAPWVISVAAGTIDHHRGVFSSNGLAFDNSEPVHIGAGGHTVFTGVRIGIYHPDVTAPGVSISSSCATSGTIVRACPPGSNATASGTSMAAPHVAGAAAVLLQANPALTIDQVRQILQVTATPVAADDGSALPFWQVGYGYVDLSAAVNIARSRQMAKDVARAQSRADARVLAADGYRVTRSDFWTYDAPRVALACSDSRTVSTAVPVGTTHMKVAISHPSGAALGLNGPLSYTVTVRDAAGKPLGTTSETMTQGAGTATVLIDLRSTTLQPVTYGPFMFEVRGEISVSDPDTIDSESALGRMVTLQVAQLVAAP